ncbi:MAG: TolC family protein [Sandarakinorhabdus sp.]|nr:TolC family protein [Sandarakinorhabdus sp.]
MMPVTAAPAVSAVAEPVPVSLDAAIDAGLSANIDMVSARNAVRSAAAGVRSADTFPNPLLSLGATSLTPGRHLPPGTSPSGDKIVRIDQLIELGGKRRARVASARDALSAADSDVIDTQRQVRAAVTNGWFDLMAAEKRLDLYASIARSYGASQTIAERRLQAGAISAGDLARPRTEMLRAQSDAARAGIDRREAQLALAVLIGRETDAAALQTIGDGKLPATAMAATDAESIAERRPDVRAADARLSAARNALTGARALRHPDISVGAQYENDQNGVGSSVGLGLAIPLQIGNRYGGAIGAAGTDVAQAEANAAKVRAVAIAEIRTARRSADDASARRARYDDDLLPSARKAAASAEFAYARGALALLDLLDARRTLQAIELAAIDARTDEAKALARRIAAETPEETP